MRKEIIIGGKIFKYKKNALAYFKAILNSYTAGAILNDSDKNDVYELLKLNPKFEEMKKQGIQNFKVDKVRYNTNCFYIVKDDLTTRAFSYTKCINGKQPLSTKFSRTCRDIIQKDLRAVKQKYFNKNSQKGQVKCQETKELCFWVELVIDHRQPNTFSVIVDRFIEVQNIKLSNVKYAKVMDGVFTFEDQYLAEKFRAYHKQKANLRIVKKGLNLGRSHQARIKQQKKDLKVE